MTQLHYQENLENILKNGENESIEFKSIMTDPKILAREIGAFANHKGGTILIGIGYNGEVSGTDINTVKQVLEKAKNLLYPLPEIHLNEIQYKGKSIATISVNSSRGIPISAGGSLLIRTGSQVRPANASEISSLLLLQNSSGTKYLNELSESMSRQTIALESLQDDLSKSNSWRKKIIEWLIAAVIGAIIGKLI
ncbi:MAG: RNA-binding domain-containing protein [Methanothrix sp.]